MKSAGGFTSRLSVSRSRRTSSVSPPSTPAASRLLRRSGMHGGAHRRYRAPVGVAVQCDLDRRPHFAEDCLRIKSEGNEAHRPISKDRRLEDLRYQGKLHCRRMFHGLMPRPNCLPERKEYISGWFSKIEMFHRVLLRCSIESSACLLGRSLRRQMVQNFIVRP